MRRAVIRVTSSAIWVCIGILRVTFPIESMQVHRSLRPKPSKILLRKLLAREKVHPRRAILIEDTVKTLKAAKSLGMRTAWVTQYLAGNPLDTGQSVNFSQLPHIKRPAYVDVKVKSVRQLAQHLGRLQSSPL